MSVTLYVSKGWSQIPKDKLHQLQKELKFPLPEHPKQQSTSLSSLYPVENMMPGYDSEEEELDHPEAAPLPGDDLDLDKPDPREPDITEEETHITKHQQSNSEQPSIRTRAEEEQLKAHIQGGHGRITSLP